VTVDALAIAVSLAVLVAAGDQFVIGAERLARTLDLRPTVVGALIGGFGTSLPELIVAGVAAGQGSAQIAVGSVVGSIVANVSLALAIAGLVSPVRVDSRTIRREAPISVGAILLLAIVVWRGLSWRTGLVLVVALVAAVASLLASARSETRSQELAVEVERFVGREGRRHPMKELWRTLTSLVAMLAAATILVRSAQALADRLGLAQGLVGLTIVAIGTSAPLIASSIQAARRGNHDLVVGNVLGGNLFIALAGGAIIAFVHGGAGAGTTGGSLWLMAGVCVGAWAFLARRRVLTRWEAAVLLAAYAAAMPFAAR